MITELVAASALASGAFSLPATAVLPRGDRSRDLEHAEFLTERELDRRREEMNMMPTTRAERLRNSRRSGGTTVIVEPDAANNRYTSDLRDRGMAMSAAELQRQATSSAAPSLRGFENVRPLDRASSQMYDSLGMSGAFAFGSLGDSGRRSPFIPLGAREDAFRPFGMNSSLGGRGLGMGSLSPRGAGDVDAFGMSRSRSSLSSDRPRLRGFGSGPDNSSRPIGSQTMSDRLSRGL